MPDGSHPHTSHKKDEAMRLVQHLLRIPSHLVIALVRCYQRCLSPMWGPVCRFTPTCSEYFIQSVRRYGMVRGSCRGIRRILKCHPFHPGGIDPP
ncbi:MAG: membrane protein insertion efficiency factor YidD [Aeoliella sp.]